MHGNNQTSLLELDATTVQAVEQLARNWGVSTQEAVRRAVSQAGATATPPSNSEKLAAFKELQRSLQLTPAKAAEWQAAVRDARR